MNKMLMTGALVVAAPGSPVQLVMGMLIMMAFMLPALFILIGGPAVISIAEALG